MKNYKPSLILAHGLADHDIFMDRLGRVWFRVNGVSVTERVQVVGVQSLMSVVGRKVLRIGNLDELKLQED